MLDGTPIKELPLSIKDMVCLRYLTLHGTPIKVLPELSPSLRSLTAHDCASLETMISTIPIGSLWDVLNFANCFKLDQKPLIAAMHLKIQGSEIPEWFGDKGIGSSLTIQLPSNCHHLKGIAFCLVFLLPLPSHDMLYRFDDHPEVRIYFDCHIKSKNDDGDDDEVFISKKSYTIYNFLKTCDSDHMFLHYELGIVDHFRKYCGNEVTFKFHNEVDNGKTKVGHDIRKPCKLKSCGVYLHFDVNLRANTLLRIFLNKQKLRRKLRER
ncbi:hypothetical protein OIU84_027024 [Salix udensis]|uniref:C-JID domain-containing protein n=1 Tax=Salix udensis TaxID=889485 RepID=A0AAD6PA85_9ROSI|nr:hypothetical protein OIU84_027024 [Salix udensis]